MFFREGLVSKLQQKLACLALVYAFCLLRQNCANWLREGSCTEIERDVARPDVETLSVAGIRSRAHTHGGLPVVSLGLPAAALKQTVAVAR